MWCNFACGLPTDFIQYLNRWQGLSLHKLQEGAPSRGYIGNLFGHAEFVDGRNGFSATGNLEARVVCNRLRNRLCARRKGIELEHA